MSGLSIRWRLTFWYSGVVAVVLAAFGFSVYLLMRHHMLERVDDGLREEMSDVLGEVERATERSDMLVWLNRRFAQHKGFDFQVTTLDGERLFSNPRLGDRRLPIPAALAAKRDHYASLELEGDHRWRVVTRLAVGPDGPLVVQVARSLDEYQHEMAELLTVQLVAGPSALLVALSGGYFLASRALAPVDRLTAAANRVTAQHLNQRLDVANSDDELGRLGQTLNGMIRRLERSFVEMQRFTADASHELRTPLAVIRTEAEVALNKPLNEKEMQAVLSNILEECERLSHITEQLLTLSREDAGIAVSPHAPVDLADLVKTTVETMRPLAEMKSQQLSASSDGRALVSGDPSRLRQALYNLLDNAIKYTPQRGRIEVWIDTTETAVRIVVQDNGIGIPPEHLPHIFDRFYRVDKARCRAEGGSGLGLSIVQSIITAHGGRVELQSVPQQGTVCTLHFPLLSV